MSMRSTISIKSSASKDLPPKHSTTSPLKSKNAISSPRVLSKPIMKITKSSDSDTFPSEFSKVVLSSKIWYDLKVSWNSLPPNIRNAGKEVRNYRNAAFESAVCALEDASASEGIIRCMSMFAELCDTSPQSSPGKLVEQFLSLHESMQNAAGFIKELINSRISEANSTSDSGSPCPSPKINHAAVNKSASLWVQAAIETDLSKFSLLKNEGGNSHYIILENTPKKIGMENYSPKNKQSPVNTPSSRSDPNLKVVSSHSRRRPSTPNVSKSRQETRPQGSPLKDAFTLAEKLLSSSRAWFLNYLETSFDDGFGLTGQTNSSELAGLLGQLKRVDRWLTNEFQEGGRFDERVERLKKKLYGFLLDHVDCAMLTGK